MIRERRLEESAAEKLVYIEFSRILLIKHINQELMGEKLKNAKEPIPIKCNALMDLKQVYFCQ
jgi:hypothetical protein